MTTAATIVLILAVALWMAEFILFPSRRNGKVKNDDKSFLLFTVAIIFSISLAIVLNRLNLGKVRGPERNLMFMAGAVMALAGIGLRYFSILKMGKNFSRRIQAFPDQELVENGPFRRLRHPAYSGLWLLTAGVVLFTTNLATFVFTLPLLLTVILMRVKREEEFMEEVIGERYRRWKKSRRRLFPFIY